MKKIMLGAILAIIIAIVPLLSVAGVGDPCYAEVIAPYCDNNKTIDGYWWYGFWIPGLPTFETQLGPTPPVTIGKALIYAPEVMEATAEARGLSLEGYVGAISTPTCGNIGLDFWLKRDGYTWEGPFLAVDCSRRNDMYGHIMYMNVAVEVDFETAVRWKLAKYGGDQHEGRWSTIASAPDNVIVSKYNPHTTKITHAIKMKDWYKNFVTYDTCDRCSWIMYDGGSNWRLDGEIIIFKQPIPPIELEIHENKMHRMFRMLDSCMDIR